MLQKLGLLLACCFFYTLSIQAQDLPLGDSQKYVIGDIKVTGNYSYNEQTVIAVTGLQKGDEVYIPGNRISKVLKKLWDLGLFSDINLYITDVHDGNVADLELEIQEVPVLAEVKIQGLKKKSAKEDLIKEDNLKPGVKVTENLVTNTKNYIQNKYKKEGFFNTKVAINTIPVEDTTGVKKVNMLVNVDKGEKVKIDEINFEGNEKFSDAKLQKAMKNTKEKNFFRFWKRSKFIADKYEEDKTKVIDKYKEKGFRDARILSDTLIRKGPEEVALNIKVEEGDKYYIGNIDFIGNTVYSDEQLAKVLKIQKGDVYNGVLLQKQIDEGDPQSVNIANLYKNNGYLFAQINPVETKVYNDTIDFEVRIIEGKEAFFNEVSVVGNEKTKDHVIYRELRTKPGQKYNQSNVVRTIRELGQLGFFDAQNIKPNFKNVDPNEGTLDMEYSVQEAGASQIELQGGYGGGGFVGTLGLSFNNFSLSGIFDKDAYHPLPMGDGQTLSLRAQASIYYQTYSLSFIEPWLGGKKPVSFSTSFSFTRQFQYNYLERKADKSQSFDILGINVGLAKKLQWPDDFFTLSQAVGFQRYNLHNFNTGLFSFGNGYSNNLTYTLGISRDNTRFNPVFPTGGSQFAVTAKFTPPYSLWNGVDYANLGNKKEFQLQDANGNLLNSDGTRLRPGDEPVADQSKIDQEKFKWLEFYKIKFDASWYTTLFHFGGESDLVLKTHAEYGFLGAYDHERGIPPFERFYLGGDGLGSYSLDGREAISLRGYPNQSVVPLDRSSLSEASNQDGAVIYNKYSLELRFPITLKPAASIYVLSFLEAGASYDNFRDFNPFQLNRSAGVGLRIFMPQFGLLGIDFGYGFDPVPGQTGPNGWETHFIIGHDL